MKRCLFKLILFIVFIATLVACQATPEPVLYSINPNDIQEIHIVNTSGRKALIDTTESIKTLIDTLNAGAPIENNLSAEALPAEQYRLTLYDANAKQSETIVIFSADYIQIGTQLYKGSFSTLTTLLSSYYAAIPLKELLQPINEKAKQIEEIAVHSVRDNNYKIITASTDITNFLNMLNESKETNQVVDTSLQTEHYRLYFRYANEQQYSEILSIYKTDDHYVLAYENKITHISELQFDSYYSTLPYNLIP